MKKQIMTFLSVALLGLAGHQAHASVVLSNLDPANPSSSFTAQTIGEAILTSSRPISLTSVMLLQATGLTTGESVAVYSRNADGSLGTPLFSGFTVGFDSTSMVTTATVNGAFTLQANSGYYFVLGSNSTSNVEWSYTSSTDYAASFGVTIPTTRATFATFGGAPLYFDLSAGPQLFQVNGSGLAAVPEPAASVWIGLVVAGGVTMIARRRSAKA